MVCESYLINAVKKSTSRQLGIKVNHVRAVVTSEKEESGGGEWAWETFKYIGKFFVFQFWQYIQRYLFYYTL